MPAVRRRRRSRGSTTAGCCSACWCWRSAGSRKKKKRGRAVDDSEVEGGALAERVPRDLGRQASAPSGVRRLLRADAALGSPACEGTSVEVGAGSGNLGAALPHTLASDIVASPWLDLALGDVQRLPFADGSIANLVGVDVLHHIEYPWLFLAEAQRVLMPGGRIVLVEPAITPVSRVVFKLGHPEPVDLTVDPLAVGEPDPGKHPFDSNQALPTLLAGPFRAQVWRREPLGLDVVLHAESHQPGGVPAVRRVPPLVAAAEPPWWGRRCASSAGWRPASGATPASGCCWCSNGASTASEDLCLVRPGAPSQRSGIVVHVRRDRCSETPGVAPEEYPPPLSRCRRSRHPIRIGPYVTPLVDRPRGSADEAGPTARVW